ncbi:MAG: YggT family protein [Gammaproteobacteria bacterium]|nr:YggT family protein [Gammaproteobacteria bacterium]
MNYLANATNFLSQAIIGFALYVVLLRFWMQWVRADFRNQIGQFIITVTNPVVLPLRKILPSIGAVDSATVVLAFCIALLKVFILFSLHKANLEPLRLAVVALSQVILFSIHLFMAAVIIQVIASWINPHGYNPIVAVAHAIAEPILAPARRLIPSIGGLDLSPILVFLFLQLTIQLVVYPLQNF